MTRSHEELEDHIRRALDRAARDLPVAPVAWQDPPTRTRGWRPRRVALPVGSLLVAAAVVVAVIVLAGHHTASLGPTVNHGGPRPIGSHPSQLRIRVEPGGAILRRSGPTAVLVSDGSLWVAGSRFIARIDPQSGAVLARIPVPSSGVGSCQLASGAGSIWAAYTGTPNVLRIDPTTNRVTAEIEHGRLPDGGGVAFADERVWVSRDSTKPRSYVSAIDPRTNRLTGDSITVGTGPGSLASGFGSLWVSNTSDPHSNLSRVDPRTGRMSYLAFGGIPFIGFGSVWVTPFRSGPIHRYDPRTPFVSATIDVRRGSAVAFGDGRVWIGSAPKSSSTRIFKPIPGTARLSEIDPRTNQIIGQPLRLPANLAPDLLAVSGDNLWVGDYSNGLTHFRILP
jgi:DNA-binding beta-propeller fold protein YncE